MGSNKQPWMPKLRKQAGLFVKTDGGERMSRVHKFVCETCGTERECVNRWFIAEVTAKGVLFSPWDGVRAQAANIHHFCGEAHAQVFLSRYLASPAEFAPYRAPQLNPHDKDLTRVQSHIVSRVLEQPAEIGSDEDEIMDLLAAAEAALKGKITLGLIASDHFDT
jgi:hypothetical protein